MSTTDQNIPDRPALVGGASYPTFIPGENPDDFSALLEDQFRRYQPSTYFQSLLVTNVVLALWYLRRCELRCALSESNNSASSKFLERYRAHCELSVKLSLRSLHTYQQHLLREQKHQQTLAKKNLRLEEQRARLELVRTKAAYLQKAAELERADQNPPQTFASTPSDRLIAVIKPDPALRRRR